jgi:hypothetical protein
MHELERLKKKTSTVLAIVMPKRVGAWNTIHMPLDVMRAKSSCG